MVPIKIEHLTKDIDIEQYTSLIERIEEAYPAIQSDSMSFYKSHSQFMETMLVVTALTPIRNARQILAEVNKARQALEEAVVNNEQRSVKRDIKLRAANNETDKLKKKLFELDAKKYEIDIKNTENYIFGAVRKVSAYMTQYQSILKSMGRTELTEEDFEKEEERYHIGKAFEQALLAARSHGGVIDEGNHIYLHQIGINGGMAQMEVSHYLALEQKMMSENIPPTHEMTIKWLNDLMDKYAGSAANYATAKGLKLVDTLSLHRKIAY